MPRRKRVLLAAMGGTIASSRTGDEGAVVDREAADLLAALPRAESLADIVSVDICGKPSRAIDPDDMSELAHRVTTSIADGFEAVVVTHGTDTIEETAYALALQVRSTVPIVLTGAMRTLDEPGSDATGNLLAALVVAVSEDTAALGPVVVMDDEIHVARWVTKARTVGAGAFVSPTVGPAGAVAEGKVRLAWRPASTEYVGLPSRLQARVETILVGAGSDRALVDGAAEFCDGIVVAGTGGGHVPPPMVPAIAAAIERGVEVVLASRTNAGPILERSNAGAGSEQELLELGANSAGSLAPLKARMRLLVALSCGLKAHEVFPSW